MVLENRRLLIAIRPRIERFQPLNRPGPAVFHIKPAGRSPSGLVRSVKGKSARCCRYNY